jgi:hypothetical protein
MIYGLWQACLLLETPTFCSGGNFANAHADGLKSQGAASRSGATSCTRVDDPTCVIAALGESVHEFRQCLVERL